MEKLTLIKVGGKIVEEEDTLRNLLHDFAKIESHKVLVHGGGRSATKLASQLGIESRMVNGRRITDIEMLRIVTMVYGGLVNKNIVAGLQAQADGCRHESDSFGQTSRRRSGLWLRGRRQGGQCRAAGFTHPTRGRPGSCPTDARQTGAYPQHQCRHHRGRNGQSAGPPLRRHPDVLL